MVLSGVMFCSCVINISGGFSEQRSCIEKPSSSLDVTERSSVKSIDDEVFLATKKNGIEKPRSKRLFI